MVSLPQMRGFIVLAKHCSFKRAAQELGISQPALSSQLAALERTLGLQLVKRTTRSIQLTPIGESFLRRSRRVLSELDSIVNDISNPSAVQRGIVTFACIPTIAGEIFPRIIRQYRKRHPEVVIELVDEETIGMEGKIANREVDFGVGGPPSRAELDFEQVFGDPFVVVCRRDMPLAQRTCVPLSKALSYPIISLLRDSNVRQTINTYFSKLDVEFEPAFEATHHYTVGAMVEAGLGITLLPSVAVHHIKWSRNLKIVRLAESDFVRPVGLITRPGDSLSDMAENFRAFTLNVMKSLAAEKSFNVSRISDAPRSKQSKRNQVR